MGVSQCHPSLNGCPALRIAFRGFLGDNLERLRELGVESLRYPERGLNHGPQADLAQQPLALRAPRLEIRLPDLGRHGDLLPQRVVMGLDALVGRLAALDAPHQSKMLDGLGIAALVVAHLGAVANELLGAQPPIFGDRDHERRHVRGLLVQVNRRYQDVFPPVFLGQPVHRALVEVRFPAGIGIDPPLRRRAQDVLDS